MRKKPCACWHTVPCTFRHTYRRKRLSNGGKKNLRIPKNLEISFFGENGHEKPQDVNLSVFEAVCKILAELATQIVRMTPHVLSHSR